MLNDLKELNLKNWTYLVKDRKAWYEIMQKSKSTMGCCVISNSKRKIRRSRRRRIPTEIKRWLRPGNTHLYKSPLNDGCAHFVPYRSSPD